jgi:hypothetical protein
VNGPERTFRFAVVRVYVVALSTHVGSPTPSRRIAELAGTTSGDTTIPTVRTVIRATATDMTSTATSHESTFERKVTSCIRSGIPGTTSRYQSMMTKNAMRSRQSLQ